MTSRDFAFWLQGFLELKEQEQEPLTISPSQVLIIKRHLKLVFVHEIDPSIGGDTTTLQAVHDGDDNADIAPLFHKGKPDGGSLMRC